jgi:hypothetical protein
MVFTYTGIPTQFALRKNLNEDSITRAFVERVTNKDCHNNRGEGNKTHPFKSRGRFLSEKILSAGVYCRECHALRNSPKVTFVNGSELVAV